MMAEEYDDGPYSSSDSGDDSDDDMMDSDTMAEKYDGGPYSTSDSGDDSDDDMMDSDDDDLMGSGLNLAATLKKLKPGEDVKDALVYGWDSIKKEKRGPEAKIRCLLGLQDGSTSSARPLVDIFNEVYAGCVHLNTNASTVVSI